MRINTVLQILKAHLLRYDDLAGKVKIANVAETAALSADMILISLVKISEENTLRNGKYSKLNQNFKTVYKNRPIHANLFVLFSCNHTDYNLSLTMLSQVVEFFQGQNVFTHLDGQNGVINNIGNPDEKFKLILELQDLSFEQINYIWSSLGGKQLPSVMYKVRVIPLEAKGKQNGEGEPILEVNINGTANY